MPLGTARDGRRRDRKRVLGIGRLGCVAIALSGLAVASCQLGSGFEYVSHRTPDGVDLYFKVPTQWSIFDTKQVIEAQNGKLGPTQLKQIANGNWIETMSPRPRVTAKETLRIGQRFPTATVESLQLGVTQRDDLNFSAMRSEILGTDPLTATSGFQVLSYSEFSAAGGIRGIRMIVNLTSTTPVLTFGQVTAVDANTNWLFSIGVGCQASCWGANAGAVTSLLKSWTVKEQAP